MTDTNNDHLVQSSDPKHPANLIPDLCRRFYNWGWVTGTGGGVRSLPLPPVLPLPCRIKHPDAKAQSIMIDFHPSWQPHLHRPLGRAEGNDGVR